MKNKNLLGCIVLFSLMFISFRSRAALVDSPACQQEYRDLVSKHESFFAKYLEFYKNDLNVSMEISVIVRDEMARLLKEDSSFSERITRLDEAFGRTYSIVEKEYGQREKSPDTLNEMQDITLDRNREAAGPIVEEQMQLLQKNFVQALNKVPGSEFVSCTDNGSDDRGWPRMLKTAECRSVIHRTEEDGSSGKIYFLTFLINLTDLGDSISYMFAHPNLGGSADLAANSLGFNTSWPPYVDTLFQAAGSDSLIAESYVEIMLQNKNDSSVVTTDAEDEDLSSGVSFWSEDNLLSKGAKHYADLALSPGCRQN